MQEDRRNISFFLSLWKMEEWKNMKQNNQMSKFQALTFYLLGSRMKCRYTVLKINNKKMFEYRDL